MGVSFIMFGLVCDRPGSPSDLVKSWGGECDGRVQGTSAGGWAYGPQYHVVYIGWSTCSYHGAVSCQSVQIAGNGSIYSVVGGRMASFA